MPQIMEKRPKTLFQLDSPFTAIQWPGTTPQNQETILALLFSLLTPIGQYRANHVPVSKGKRDRKRRRREAGMSTAPAIPAPPPVPRISAFLAVGLHSITRILEASSRYLKPKEETKEVAGDATEDFRLPETAESTPEIDSLTLTHFSAIFVCRSSDAVPQPLVLMEYLPQLITMAAKAHPSLPLTRLVSLPAGSAKKLSEALGIPRVSLIGLLDGAPHSKALLDIVRDCVPEVEIPWLQEVKDRKYLPVKVRAIETLVPVAVDRNKVKIEK